MHLTCAQCGVQRQLAIGDRSQGNVCLKSEPAATKSLHGQRFQHVNHFIDSISKTSNADAADTRSQADRDMVQEHHEFTLAVTSTGKVPYGKSSRSHTT
eukprot:6178393-Pleurochrysis_carterae.AAC.1